MQTQTLIIPCELPDLNTTLSESKRHWSKYSRLKREYTALVAALARRQLRPVVSGRVHLSFVWYCRNRRKDPDNVCSAKKFIIDGLVTAGILANDGWQQVSSFSDTFEIDPVNPRVEVIIKICNHEKNAC